MLKQPNKAMKKFMIQKENDRHKKELDQIKQKGSGLVDNN